MLRREKQGAMAERNTLLLLRIGPSAAQTRGGRMRLAASFGTRRKPLTGNTADERESEANSANARAIEPDYAMR